MIFLIDENIESEIVELLIDLKFQFRLVVEIQQGAEDREIIEWSKATGAVIITRDKDFGEWFFAHKIKGAGVIFLRNKKDEFELTKETIKKYLSEGVIDLSNKFVTIKGNKIRIRNY